ncbi:hypothetical protein FDJ32_gp15 [Pseudomonas phage NV1]|uniref:Uncharacterized protein n=1 Tax=Pseudomonas phage NV1 TaxID=2079543 RepID=A0A2L0HPX9_9CAUD|nr:hypothetical protein FDJ32_gp15 [Pseudomonas phage NV1]AUX83644.1 hypothetical protein NV1_p15 [Pseudomonas phage NV1]
MSVHGVFYQTVEDDTKNLVNMNNWGNCWGAFQNVQGVAPRGQVVDVHVLVRMDERYKKYVEPFMDSKFFKELTDNKYHLTQMNPSVFNDQRLMAHQMSPENYIEVVFKSDLAAARVITASRLLTSLRLLAHTSGGSTESLNRIPQDQWHLLPLVVNAINTDGNSYSDSYVTFVPITKGELLEEADGDELYDVDVDDGFQNIADKYHKGAMISVQMLKRILSRTSQEFQDLTSQTWSLMDREYYKDCEADEWLKGDDIPHDTFISVGSPVQDVMRDGETRITGNIGTLLAQLE